MSGEIIYALLNNKIKKLAKKVEEGGLPEGTVIPTKLSDLENDLFGQTERIVIEAASDDFKALQDGGNALSQMCGITVSEINSGNITLSGFAMAGEKVDAFDLRAISSDDLPYFAIVYNGLFLGELVFGVAITDDGREEYVDGAVTAVIAAQALEMFEFVKITAMRTKKIPAECVESSQFIAKFNETPFADIKAAWDSDINCCIDLGSLGDNVRVPVNRCTDTQIAAIIPTDNGAVIEVTVTNANVWDFKLRFILPETTNMDVGKFLRVNSDGQWIAAEVPSAEGGSF